MWRNTYVWSTGVQYPRLHICARGWPHASHSPSAVCCRPRSPSRTLTFHIPRANASHVGKIRCAWFSHALKQVWGSFKDLLILIYGKWNIFPFKNSIITQDDNKDIQCGCNLTRNHLNCIVGEFEEGKIPHAAPLTLQCLHSAAVDWPARTWSRGRQNMSFSWRRVKSTSWSYRARKPIPGSVSK